MQYDDPRYEEAETDFYLHEYAYDDDDGYVREEPDCYSCSDSGWFRPGGWRLLVAQLAPLIWGRGGPWLWRPRRGAWPCRGCNVCWVDWQLSRLDRLLVLLRLRRDPFRSMRVGNFDDEAPF